MVSMEKGQFMELDEQVIIELRKDEALVLFELLTRWSETSQRVVHLEHQAEARVLLDILATLERRLAEPFMTDYADQLAQARRMVQDES
jgi:hypothetical protein